MTDPKLHHMPLCAEPPRQFTYPFHYTPHPLCLEAAAQVRHYLDFRTDWAAELDEGKMLGVLVVRDSEGNTGFLAAFSGNLAGSNVHSYFVPPVYDLLQPNGEFRQGEDAISGINRKISQLEQSATLARLRAGASSARAEADSRTAAFKAMMAEARQRRNALRSAGGIDAATAQRLVAESQWQKAELKRIRRQGEVQCAKAEAALQEFTDRIDELKSRRKTMSEALQRRIFSLFVVRNAMGQTSDLNAIFAASTGGTPPAGAGECAAPKLLNYAYAHSMQPLCMAEFWWGKSPTATIRRHGHFYPACHSKCKPILGFMLQGLSVEPNPLAAEPDDDQKRLQVVYDDEWLVVVNKPAGVLSVPGKLHGHSVQGALRALLPNASGPLVVHRLDMATSGLLLAAKSKDVHKALQEQFATRKVAKTYVAVVGGTVEADSGYVRLPLRPDPDDRPRQVVDGEHGKPAVTAWRVTRRNADGTVRLELHPLTGRTHQLRVHCAHHLGLNAPIVGDTLYGGHAAPRLMLHAKSITFTHPVTGRRITVTTPAPF